MAFPNPGASPLMTVQVTSTVFTAGGDPMLRNLGAFFATHTHTHTPHIHAHVHTHTK
jgi:hypothetical protein